MSELKKLDLSKDSFTANGREYFFKNTLTIARYEAFEELQIKLGFTHDFKSMYGHLGSIIKLFNDNKDVQAKAMLYNTYSSIGERLDKRTAPALELCCLFIITQDEDITVIDETVMKSKIEDWKKEGFDMMDFFQLALNLLPSYIETWKATSLTGLEQTKSQKKK
jgi:hypothetical protein